MLIGLSLLAFALSAYLGWHTVLGGSVPGCGAGSSCDQVLSSRWSTVGGVVPVSGLAAGVYLAMLAASLFVGPATAPPVRHLAWTALLVLVGAAAGSAAWFTVVQKWFIGAFCPYCMATHTIGVLLAILVLWRAPRETTESEIRLSSLFRISNLGIRIWTLAGVALAGILAAGQVALTPGPGYRAGDSQANLSVIDAQTAPLIGSPDAPHIVKVLFDYECPHCQQLHFLLSEVVRRYEGKLAFALCPTPLNSQCNPYVPRDADKFKDSCELAKIGLAVWLANREAFPAFELWMFSLESGDRWRPRSIVDAKAKAVELVGQVEFDRALADPWIDSYLSSAVQLFADTGSNAIPKLIFGSRWVIPQAYDADDLVWILHESLGLPKP